MIRFLGRVRPSGISSVVLGFLLLIVTTVSMQAQENDDTTQDAAPAVELADAGVSAARLNDPGMVLTEFKLRLIPLPAGELEALMEDWLALLRQETEKIVEIQIAIDRTADEAERETLRERLVRLTHARRGTFDRYGEVLTAWENKGGDLDAIADYWAYRRSIILAEIHDEDLRTLLARLGAFIVDEEGGRRIAIDVLVVAVALVGLLLAASVVRRLVGLWAGRIRNLSKLLRAFLALAAYWLTVAIGLMIVLTSLGVNVTPLFALVGGATFILAFAMQSTLSNLAAGLLILINRPFDEGDVVDISDVHGTVRNVSIVSTTIVTPDNRMIVVPNSSIWGTVITNATASATRRVDLTFTVSHATPIARAQQELDRTMREHPLVLEDPEPLVRVNTFGETGVDFIVRPWTRSADYWTVYWDLTRQVKEALDRAGMEEIEPSTPLHEGPKPSLLAPVLQST